MRAKTGLFWQSLGLTLLLVLPMVGTLAWFSGQREHQQQLKQAAAAQSGVPVEAGAQNVLRLLAAVQGEEPAFVLVRLDCPARTAALCGLPGEMTVAAPTGQTTLAACYLSAGPARAAQLLAATVGRAPDAYFAATAERWAALAGPGLTVRFDTGAVLDLAQRTALGFGADPVAEFTPADAAALLARAGAQSMLPAAGMARLRAALWAAFPRQNPETLTALPTAMREQSAYTLTDLNAQALYTLQDTVDYLAGQGAAVEYETLTGDGKETFVPDAAGRALLERLLD